MNKTGSNSGHFVKYWVKLILLKYTDKMVISDQKSKKKHHGAQNPQGLSGLAALLLFYPTGKVEFGCVSENGHYLNQFCS